MGQVEATDSFLQRPTWKAPHETKKETNQAKGDRSVGGLCALWDKVKLVLAVFYCLLHTPVRFSCAELRTNTNTAKGDPGWLTGTSSVRKVCSTLPEAPQKATCCLTAKPFFLAISIFKEIRLSAADQQPLGRFGPHLGLQNCRVTNPSREKISGRSTINACSLSSDYRITSNASNNFLITFESKCLISCFQGNNIKRTNSSQF